MASTSKGSTQIDYIIGMPPERLSDDTINGRTQILMENSMPIVKIYPGIPSFTFGLSLFKREPAFRTSGQSPNSLAYLPMLESHGVYLKQPKFTSGKGKEGCLVLAYQADSFPTDSFTNDYGENFLQGMTNVASEAAASLAQMSGSQTATGAFQNLTATLKAKGGITGMIGGGLNAAGSMAGSVINAIMPPSIMGGINVVNRLMAGARLDFPMIWKTSAFQPSYTMTIRLYNPYPSDLEATKKYIMAPIAAIMMLGVPLSADGVTYSWPFIHRIVSPGIYDLDPAFISNITVIKGGDQQQISFKQRLGIVDVRIDFGSLFSSMLATPKKSIGRTRPTLSSYLDGISGTDAYKPGVQKFSTTPGESATQAQAQTTTTLEENTPVATTKNQAPKTTELTATEKYNPPSRITTDIKDAAAYLKSKLPSF